MSIDIASPGGNEAALRDALRDLIGWVNVNASGAPGANPAWDQAIHGSAANVDVVGLAGAQDILIIARLVTKATTGVLQVRASVDNGSSYYAASGDYQAVDEAGVEVASIALGNLHGTNATAARSGFLQIFAPNINGVPKLARGHTAIVNVPDRLLVASFSPIDAVRVFANNGGNLTGGKIYCLVRR